jgi:ribosomal protein S27E
MKTLRIRCQYCRRITVVQVESRFEAACSSCLAEIKGSKTFVWLQSRVFNRAILHAA